jgi:hypothetical protein
MLGVVVYLYATSATLWGLNVTLWFKRTHDMLMANIDLGLADRLDIGNLNVDLLGTPMEALFMFNVRRLPQIPFRALKPPLDDCRGQRGHMARLGALSTLTNCRGRAVPHADHVVQCVKNSVSVFYLLTCLQSLRGHRHDLPHELRLERLDRHRQRRRRLRTLGAHRLGLLTRHKRKLYPLHHT